MQEKIVEVYDVFWDKYKKDIEEKCKLRPQGSFYDKPIWGGVFL